MRFKRFFLQSILITFALTSFLFAESFTVDGITYSINYYEDEYAGIKKEIPAGKAFLTCLPSKQKSLKISSSVKYKNKNYKVSEIFYASGVSIYKYGRELESVKIEEGIEKIGFNAFFECDKLKEIYIPATCIEIDLEAGLPHKDSSGLHNYCDFEKIFVAENNPVYFSKNGILYDKKTGKVLFVPHRNKSK